MVLPPSPASSHRLFQLMWLLLPWLLLLQLRHPCEITGFPETGNFSSPSVSFVTVPSQKIFNLSKFLPSYSPEESSCVVITLSGEMRTKPIANRISSPQMWISAAMGLGRHLFLLRVQSKELEFSMDH